jgi:hypothetical protein
MIARLVGCVVLAALAGGGCGSEPGPTGGGGGVATGGAGGAGGSASTTTSSGPDCGCLLGEGGCSAAEREDACGESCCGPVAVSACVVKDAAPLCLGLSEACQLDPSCACVMTQLPGVTDCLWVGG